MLANRTNDDGIRAMCLNDNGPNFQKWLNRVGKCEAHEAGRPIDERYGYKNER